MYVFKLTSKIQNLSQHSFNLAVDNAGTDPYKDPPGAKQTDYEVKNMVCLLLPVQKG